MNKYRGNCCPPPKRKKKKPADCKKIGILMVLLGILTVLALFLPSNCWAVILSAALVIFGIILLRTASR